MSQPDRGFALKQWIENWARVKKAGGDDAPAPAEVPRPRTAAPSVNRAEPMRQSSAFEDMPIGAKRPNTSAAPAATARAATAQPVVASPQPKRPLYDDDADDLYMPPKPRMSTSPTRRGGQLSAAAAPVSASMPMSMDARSRVQMEQPDRGFDVRGSSSRYVEEPAPMSRNSRYIEEPAVPSRSRQIEDPPIARSRQAEELMSRSVTASRQPCAHCAEKDKKIAELLEITRTLVERMGAVYNTMEEAVLEAKSDLAFATRN